MSDAHRTGAGAGTGSNGTGSLTNGGGSGAASSNGTNGVSAGSSSTDAEQRLQSVSLFEQMPAHHVAEYARQLERQELKAGCQIVRQGEVGTALYLIVDGSVNVHVLGEAVAQDRPLGPEEQLWCAAGPCATSLRPCACPRVVRCTRG